MHLHLSNRRFAAWLTAVVVVAAAIAQPAAAASPLPDPDRTMGTPTGWGWLPAGSTATAISDYVADGFRLVDIEVSSASPLRFAATFVKNTGEYEQKWWWYRGKTAAQVNELLVQKDARPIDIEPYETTNGVRFAVVMVHNVGSYRKNFWWFHGKTAGELTQLAVDRNARLVDVDRYKSGGATRFVIIMIENTGVDQMSWYLYLKLTPREVAARQTQRDARLISIERVGKDSSGTSLLDVIMIKDTSTATWWWTTLTADQVSDRAHRNDARVVVADPWDNSGSRYAVLMIAN